MNHDERSLPPAVAAPSILRAATASTRPTQVSQPSGLTLQKVRSPSSAPPVTPVAGSTSSEPGSLMSSRAAGVSSLEDLLM